MEDLYYYSYTADIPATTATATLGAMLGTYSAIVIAFYVLLVIAQWKIFTKAGEAGWKSLIPVYNMVVLYKL